MLKPRTSYIFSRTRNCIFERISRFYRQDGRTHRYTSLTLSRERTTTQRAQLISDKTRVANRRQKVLEDCNIKLASVASDVLGVSGRAMLKALIERKMTPVQMADLSKMKLRAKIPQLTEALFRKEVPKWQLEAGPAAFSSTSEEARPHEQLNGGVNDHHRFMLKTVLDQVEFLEKQIGWFDERIEAVMSPLENAAVEKLDKIPGDVSHMVPYTRSADIQCARENPNGRLRFATNHFAEEADDTVASRGSLYQSQDSWRIYWTVQFRRNILTWLSKWRIQRIL